jgi:hypothetical protein
MARSIWNLGECPRKGCVKTISFVYDRKEDIVFSQPHTCTGKPYTTKENK